MASSNTGERLLKRESGDTKESWPPPQPEGAEVPRSCEERLKGNCEVIKLSGVGKV